MLLSGKSAPERKKSGSIKKFMMSWNPSILFIRAARKRPIPLSAKARININGISSRTTRKLIDTPTNGATRSIMIPWSIDVVLPPRALPTASDQRGTGATSISLRKPNSRSQIMETAPKIAVKRIAIEMIPGKIN